MNEWNQFVVQLRGFVYPTFGVDPIYNPFALHYFVMTRNGKNGLFCLNTLSVEGTQDS